MGIPAYYFIVIFVVMCLIGLDSILYHANVAYRNLVDVRETRKVHNKEE